MMIPIIPIEQRSRVSPQSDGSQALVSLRTLPPLTLYIHYPWCVRKCPYCDFNSHEHEGERPEGRYIAALRADLEQALPLIWGRRVHAVFFGGGTPSLLSVEGLDQILADVRALVPLEPDAEITLEANPGTFEYAKFEAFRRCGVNRLSIGIQSFDDRALEVIGRIHDAQTARAAAEMAQETFDNFNLDLMYGLPGQSALAAAKDLDTALSFAPPHLSLYNLTLEPNTVFAKFPPSLPDEDTIADMQDASVLRLQAAGYDGYETSAFAKSGHRSRHNLNYWNFGDYLGIGAGAHSKISFPSRVLRQERFKNPESYMQHALGGDAVSAQHDVAVAQLPFEFMLNALRLTEGASVQRFTERTGLTAMSIAAARTAAEARGLLTEDPLVLQPTALGRRFLNDLQAMFLA